MSEELVRLKKLWVVDYGKRLEVVTAYEGADLSRNDVEKLHEALGKWLGKQSVRMISERTVTYEEIAKTLWNDTTLAHLFVGHDFYLWIPRMVDALERKFR